ncbi:MAG: ribosomal-protein-alanine N-acetyltransferase [Chitinophagales bacterium]|jgi:ribosomal-protein-alanine N-acetyltransferase
MHSFFVDIFTDRLQLVPVTSSDTKFIFELVNSVGWRSYIGDFKMDSLRKVANYIERIQTTDDVYYWTVKLSATHESIGLITFLKREKLKHFDLGFAFLPQFEKQGYAFEAAETVLHILNKESNYNAIQALTIPSNKSSIRLLEKLGFKLEKKNAKSDKAALIFTLYLS